MAEIMLDLSDIELQNVSDKLRHDEWKGLGHRLGIDNLDRIKYDNEKDGLAEVIFQMLKKWQTKDGLQATKETLSKALKDIGRSDIIEELVKNSEPKTQLIAERRNKEIETLIFDEQRRLYQTVILPQAPWMKKILPLEELYVDLEMLKAQGDPGISDGIEINLQELFDKIDGVDPLRILIEGGPGIGKSTLCLKLLNDWGRNRDYIGSKFKIVFLFQLRYCKESDSIEGLLKRECMAAGVDAHEAIQCIREFQSEILLILDGFDEMNEECKIKFLPLLQKKEFPTMFVVVTSRKGMFHVQKKNEEQSAGILETLNDTKTCLWNKRVLIKGVTNDKIELFMQKYLNIDYKKMESKIIFLRKGEIKEVMENPLFLILIATMLEDKKIETVISKTSLYKDFFNFITRRSLIRERRIKNDQEIDLFNDSSNHPVIESLVQFGRLAIDFLCQNELMFEQETILEHCDDEIVLHLGFLVKLTKFQYHQADDFYQPIHKSFLEFVAAFAMWKLCNDDQDQFKRKIKRIGEQGLKPTNDSLFYVFLGGLLNSKAHVLFECLTQYYLWFNMENFCFKNMLTEIQKTDSFFSSFKPLLESFVSSVFGSQADNIDFFNSRIHSLCLKYASDRQLIRYLQWNCRFSFNSPYKEFYIETLELLVYNYTNNCIKYDSELTVRCKNVICRFDSSFNEHDWKPFVSLMHTIETETYCFDFYEVKEKFISSLVFALHKEMTKGQWKQKHINRLKIKLNEDDVNSILLLVDLVKNNRIKDGIWLNIDNLMSLTGDKKNRLKIGTQELIKAVNNSKNISEFILDMNYYVTYFPNSGLDLVSYKKWRFLRFTGDSLTFLKTIWKKKENISVEEVKISSFYDENNLHLIENIEGVKWLSCNLIILNSLIERNWAHLNEIEELELTNIDKTTLRMIPGSCSQLMNLQVLSLDIEWNYNIPPETRDSFVNLFYSLNLRICEFINIESREIFCFFTEVVMEGLKKKEEEEKNSIKDKTKSKMESKEGNKIYFNEIVVSFNGEKNWIKFKEFEVFDSIRSMLRSKRLGKFSWIYCIDYQDIKADILLSLFPRNEKFRISREVDRPNPSNSRRSQFPYSTDEYTRYRYCVQFIGY